MRVAIARRRETAERRRETSSGGCDLVLTSRWAKLLGVPTALRGLLAYATMAGIAFVRRVDQHWSLHLERGVLGRVLQRLPDDDLAHGAG